MVIALQGGFSAAEFRSSIDPNATPKSLIVEGIFELMAGRRIGAALVVGLFAVSGCTTTGLSSSTGSAWGGIAGGRASSGRARVTSTIIAAMDGGLIGGSIGSSLDDSERRSALEAEYRALEYTQSGQPVAWQGRQQGRSGQVVAAQPYRVGSQDCRQYTQTVFVAGQSRTARGTACRNPDGSWTPLT
jgi:surface antigen